MFVFSHFVFHLNVKSDISVCGTYQPLLQYLINSGFYSTYHDGTLGKKDPPLKTPFGH